LAARPFGCALFVDGGFGIAIDTDG